MGPNLATASAPLLPSSSRWMVAPGSDGNLRFQMKRSSAGRMGRKAIAGSVDWLSPLQRWSLPILRCLLWAVALAYLVLEAREVANQRQLTQITVFAVLFLVANFQINLARYLPFEHQEAKSSLQASLAMFAASLFSVLDGALDYLLASLQAVVAPGLLPIFYLMGWTVNLLSVVLAIGSMEVFLRSMQRLLDR